MEYAGIDITHPVDSVATVAGSGPSSKFWNSERHSPRRTLVQCWRVRRLGFQRCSRIQCPQLGQGNIVQDRTAPTAGQYNAIATHTGGSWVMHLVAFNRRVASANPADSERGHGTDHDCGTAVHIISKTRDIVVDGWNAVDCAKHNGPTPATSASPPNTPTSTPVAAAPSSACQAFPDASCTGVPPDWRCTVVVQRLRPAAPTTRVSSTAGWPSRPAYAKITRSMHSRPGRYRQRPRR